MQVKQVAGPHPARLTCLDPTQGMCPYVPSLFTGSLTLSSMKKACGYHLLLAPLGIPICHAATLRPSYEGLLCGGFCVFSCMLSHLAFLWVDVLTGARPPRVLSSVELQRSFSLSLSVALWDRYHIPFCPWLTSQI